MTEAICSEAYPLLNERYLPERLLGEQPSGRFVMAVDTLCGGRVTILFPRLAGVSPQRFAEGLQDEVARLVPLAETAYCTVRDVGVTPTGEAFVIVNRPQGGSLGALLRSEGRLGADRALSIVIQLCDLVRRAHVLGVFPVGLDLDSVIVDAQSGGRQRVSIVDLGWQRRLFGNAVQPPRRPSGFEAPQVRLGADPDPRDDVFALTAILHAMILGVAPPPMSAHGPADGSGWASLPDDGRGLDRRLEACLHTVLLKGLAPERDDRFPNVGALQRAFSGLRQLMSLSAPAFELLAATRGRLGQAPDALDLRTVNPAADRAAEARARVRQVVEHSFGGAANLSSLGGEVPRIASVDSGARTHDFPPREERPARPQFGVVQPGRPARVVPRTQRVHAEN